MKTRCKPGDIAMCDQQGNQAPTSEWSAGIFQVFDTLPQDFNLRMRVTGEIIEIIKKARNPGQSAKASKKVDVPYLRLVQGGRG